MNEAQLKKLLDNPKIVDKKIEFYTQKKVLVKQEFEEAEMKGHIEKAEHNSNFIQDTLKQDYTDWAIVGCYYASYHIALALLLKKGFSSKNHDATLCILIKHYYQNGLSREDIELINKTYLDNNDILFYVQSKNEREKASYSSQIAFDKKLVSDLRLKTLLFVNKGKEIIEQS
ncbi:HEPN domain-containing protein [Candidatus Woesearchaeota archaeon]|nr:HEPN domain-containing protein [Candidatus Woesearchaeota archaeon]